MIPSTWFLPALVTSLFFIGGPVLAQADVVAPLRAFLLFTASGLTGLVAVIFGVWLAAKHAKGPGLASVAVGLLPLVVLSLGVMKGKDVPRINDVATDLTDPPALTAPASAPDNVGKDLALPAEFKPQITAGYPNLKPKIVEAAPEAVYATAVAAAKGLKTWTVTREDPASLTFEASETAGIFRFVDDVTVRVRPEGTGSKIDMRSRSRVGKGDFGANAARIDRYFAALDAALSRK